MLISHIINRSCTIFDYNNEPGAKISPVAYTYKVYLLQLTNDQVIKRSGCKATPRKCVITERDIIRRNNGEQQLDRHGHSKEGLMCDICGV